MNRTHAVFLLAAAALAGCGGSGSGAVTPKPTATPAPAPLSLSTTSISMNAVGVTQQVAASETGYTGAFTVALGACSKIVSVTPANAAGPQATFTFNATGAGNCTASLLDAYGQTQNVTVTVTTTSGSLQ